MRLRPEPVRAADRAGGSSGKASFLDGRKRRAAVRRSFDEMMDLILEKARSDERIRAVTMEGSRANANAVHDAYSDFDISYYVRDIRDFTRWQSF